MRQLSKWDLRFLDLADHISLWSKDPTTQVGCVIANPDHRVIGLGFNGFPQGSDDAREKLMDREAKRLRTIHAEMNALHFATGSVEGATVYSTHHPCAACAANLIQHKPLEVIIPKSKIGELGVDWLRSLQEAKAMFDEHGIEVIEI